MSARASDRGSWWAFVPAALLSAMLGGLFAMAVVASDDPGFAIERDYYSKAVRWDDERAQQAANARLGWRVRASLGARRPDRRTALLVVIEDPHSRPITNASVSLEAFANARAAERLEAKLTERADGSYGAELPLRFPGLWELRVTVQRGDQRFTRTLRLDVPQGGV